MSNLEIYTEQLKEICQGEPENVLKAGIALIEQGLADGVSPRSQAPGYAGLSAVCNAAANLSPEEARVAELIDGMPWTEDMAACFMGLFLGVEKQSSEG